MALQADKVQQALEKTHGNVAAAAKALGCERGSLWRYIRKHPGARQVIDDQKETMLDAAEGVLQRRVLEGEAWAVCFFLKTQGKSRGYVERPTGGAGDPIHQVAYTPEQFKAEQARRRTEVAATLTAFDDDGASNA